MSKITKRALASSLKKILCKKPLSKITINDITEDCGVNRMTFYYHFRDVYDLIEWMCIEDGAKVLEGKKTYDTWQEGLGNILKLIIDNKQFICNVYHSINREHIENYLCNIVYDLLINVIEEKSIDMMVHDEDKKFIADFYKYAFVGIILNWIKMGMKENPESLVNSFSTLLSGNFVHALSNYSLNFSN